MSKKLRVAIIGLHIGTSHMEGVLEYGAEVAAICDLNPETLKKMGDRCQIPEDRRYLDYHDILALKDIDIAIIATPDQLHLKMSEEFLAAGMHVMCEKPLALTRPELEAIIALTKKYPNQKYMVGQVCRYNPGFVKMKELYDEGKIGELFFVESEYAHDYHKIMPEWRRDPNRHGVIGGGCHAVDLLRWIAGDPIEVFAYGNHKLLPMIETDDATISVLKFPNDVIGKIYVSTGCKRPYTMRTQLYGTKGTLLYESGKDFIQLYTLSEDGIAVNPTPELVKFNYRDHNMYGEFCDFARIIEEDLPVAMSAEEGAKSIATCLAIVESAKTGMPIKPNFNF